MALARKYRWVAVESPHSGRGRLAHDEPAVGKRRKVRPASPARGDIRVALGKDITAKAGFKEEALTFFKFIRG
jgi:hypothetical protein